MEQYKLRRLNNLRVMRDRLGVTQADLAKELNITPQYMSALERGLNELTYYDACLIARYLGMTPDSLFLNDSIERVKLEKVYIKQRDDELLQKRKKENERMFEELNKRNN